MKRVLVTGGGGFIGSHLVRALLARGYAVRLLENFSTGHKKNLAGLLDDVEIIDDPDGLASMEACGRAVRSVDAIFHQGAVPSVPRSLSDPVQTDRVNVSGTLSLLEAARKEGIGRFIYASSSSIYGSAEGDVRQEDDVPRPLSPYAVSKFAAERYAILFHHLYGMETVGLRYFNVFGPNQDPDSQYAAVIPIFIRELSGGRSPVIFGDGEQTRDFTFVENVVSGNLLALEAPGVGGEIINLAMGQACSVNDLFLKLRKIVGAEGVEPTYAPSRKGDVEHSLADISKAKKMLGYEASVSFEEGLRRTFEWYSKLEEGE